MLKEGKNWMAREKCMGCFWGVAIDGACWSFLGLSEMALINVLVFAVLKTLHNLVFEQKSLFPNNCWREKKFEKCSSWLCLHFECTSETVEAFA